jgi:hypothetical protein
MTLEWFRNRSGANLNMIHYPGPASPCYNPGPGREYAVSQKRVSNIRDFCEKMAIAPLSLSETPYSWRTGANRVMLLPDGPAAQIALWRAHWSVPVQRAA